MTGQTYRVRHRRSAYDGFIKVDVYEASVTDGARTVEMVREVHDHGHGATVLPVDEARRTALLVRQLRVPTHVAAGEGMFLETAAGIIDPGDANPAAAAEREAGEELGYCVRDLELLTTVYTIPGLVTEQMSCFLARYTPDDRIPGGGNADADEMIDVEEWPLSSLWRAYEAGELRDVKAVVCLLALRVRRPGLFD